MRKHNKREHYQSPSSTATGKASCWHSNSWCFRVDLDYRKKSTQLPVRTVDPANVKNLRFFHHIRKIHFRQLKHVYTRSALLKHAQGSRVARPTIDQRFEKSETRNIPQLKLPHKIKKISMDYHTSSLRTVEKWGVQ